jgi:hypothetical protein
LYTAQAIIYVVTFRPIAACTLSIRKWPDFIPQPVRFSAMILWTCTAALDQEGYTKHPMLKE